MGLEGWGTTEGCSPPQRKCPKSEQQKPSTPPDKEKKKEHGLVSCLRFG